MNCQITVNDGPGVTPNCILPDRALQDVRRICVTVHMGCSGSGLATVGTLVSGDGPQGKAPEEQQNGQYDFHAIYLCIETE
ncbi:MAG: hypothetical protein KME65_13265 [Candidatus Thiodiazotropha sp. (ex Ctena orbiculata)]|uniref:Uncharacterized protein n=1 Tax=Candidatus Thiodiazotropha taylori TaxID=2792791 RepID=A0A944MAP9_9GAMM|nr:hypothetical protein [Candidatus Thiodiazotropha taylori]